MPLDQFKIDRVASMMGLLPKPKQEQPLFVDTRAQAQSNASSLVSQGKSMVSNYITKEKEYLNRPMDPRTPEGMSNLSSVVGGFVGGGMKNVGNIVAKNLVPKVAPLFTEPLTITTKLMNSLRSTGREDVPFTEIKGLMNKGGYAKADTDLVIETARKQGDKVNLTQLQKDIEPHLVTLKPKIVPAENSALSRYGIGQDFVDNPSGYKEIIWESPIKTSAGKQHYGVYTGKHTKVPLSENYFAHTRAESLPNGDLKLIELQSDLTQGGKLQGEQIRYINFEDYMPPKMLKEYKTLTSRYGNISGAYNADSYVDEIKQIENRVRQIEEEAAVIKKQKQASRAGEIAPLQPYSSDTAAHTRTFRELINYAKQEGNKRILIPTGETAMKIEGLGSESRFQLVQESLARDSEVLATKNNIKVGLEVIPANGTDSWIITDILGDGKFKAIPKSSVESKYGTDWKEMIELNPHLSNSIESFDISGKVDQSHFVYKLNENTLPKEALKQGLQVGEPIQVGKGTYRPVDLAGSKPGPQIAFGKASLSGLLTGAGLSGLVVAENAASTEEYNKPNKPLVPNTPPKMIRDVPIQNNEISQLKRTIYSEVSNRLLPIEVKTMMNVAINESKRSGRPLMDIITDKNFFQGIMNKRYATSTAPIGDDKIIQDFVNKTVDEALNGNLEDNTNGANHFIHITSGPHKDKIVSMNEEEFVHYWKGLKSEKEKNDFAIALLGLN